MNKFQKALTVAGATVVFSAIGASIASAHTVTPAPVSVSASATGGTGGSGSGISGGAGGSGANGGGSGGHVVCATGGNGGDAGQAGTAGKVVPGCPVTKVTVSVTPTATLTTPVTNPTIVTGSPTSSSASTTAAVVAPPADVSNGTGTGVSVVNDVAAQDTGELAITGPAIEWSLLLGFGLILLGTPFLVVGAHRVGSQFGEESEIPA